MAELDQRQLAEQLLAQAKEQGVELGLGPNGLWLNPLTKNVLESELAVAAAELHGHQSVGDFARGEGLSVYALIGFLRRPFLVVTPDRPEATDANRPTARV